MDVEPTGNPKRKRTELEKKKEQIHIPVEKKEVEVEVEEKKKTTTKKMTKKQRKDKEIHKEALHNTRDTITLVAMLIATFSFNAGVTPPGGVHQDFDNPLIGTAVAARKTAFRVFWVCNNVALFVSICTVLVMVSIIPFKRGPLKMMLSVAHRAVWVAVSFMSAAYVAAQITIMDRPPQLRGVRWSSVFLVAVCSGSLGAVFVGLGIMAVRHRLSKTKWKKEKEKKEKENRQRSVTNKVDGYLSQLPVEENPTRGGDDSSTDDLVSFQLDDDDDVSSVDSDMASSLDLGYHTH